MQRDTTRESHIVDGMFEAMMAQHLRILAEKDSPERQQQLNLIHIEYESARRLPTAALEAFTLEAVRGAPEPKEGTASRQQEHSLYAVGRPPESNFEVASGPQDEY